jgi:hypothetical protein
LLANLFKYNDLSQTLLSVFSDMNEGNLSLSEGQSVIQATLNEGGNQTETKNESTGSLLDFSPANSPKPASSSSSSSSNKVPVATAVLASNDLDFFNAPPVAAVTIQSSTSTNDFDPFGSSSQSKPSLVMQPSPVLKTPVSQGSIPKLAPPPSSDKRVPFLAPPPAAGSIIGRSNAPFGVVTSGPPSVQSEPSPLTATSTPSMTPQRQQQQQSTAFDPFGNDSLLSLTSSSSTSTTAPPSANVETPMNPSPFPNYSVPSTGKLYLCFIMFFDVSPLIGLNPTHAAPNALPFSSQPGMGIYSPHPPQGMYPPVAPPGNYQNFAAFPPQGPGMMPLQPQYQPGMVPLPGQYYPPPQGSMMQPMMPPNMHMKPAGAPVNNGNNSSPANNANNSAKSDSNPFDIFA